MNAHVTPMPDTRWQQQQVTAVAHYRHDFRFQMQDRSSLSRRQRSALRPRRAGARQETSSGPPWACPANASLTIDGLQPRHVDVLVAAIGIQFGNVVAIVRPDFSDRGDRIEVRHRGPAIKNNRHAWFVRR